MFSNHWLFFSAIRFYECLQRSTIFDIMDSEGKAACSAFFCNG
nr:MAG TPA_asm: hypothetical protein [Caudoviricetes sp.]